MVQCSDIYVTVFLPDLRTIFPEKIQTGQPCKMFLPVHQVLDYSSIALASPDRYTFQKLQLEPFTMAKTNQC